MEPIALNRLALLVAVVAKQALGALWYSPLALYAIDNGVSVLALMAMGAILASW